jgi:hypothetical protein
LALRQAAPWSRKISATSRTSRITGERYAGPDGTKPLQRSAGIASGI